MARKRSHRVVVEITLAEPMTEKRAVEVVGAVLDEALDDWGVVVTAWRAKAFSKVMTWVKRKEKDDELVSMEQR